jgi:hypothetical protein
MKVPRPTVLLAALVAAYLSPPLSELAGHWGADKSWFVRACVVFLAYLAAAMTGILLAWYVERLSNWIRRVRARRGSRL